MFQSPRSHLQITLGEATVNYGENKPKTVVRRRRRLSLTWIDFLVIAATIVTFAAVLDATMARAKASSFGGYSSVQTSQLPDDPDLIRARIRLATGL